MWVGSAVRRILRPPESGQVIQPYRTEAERPAALVDSFGQAEGRPAGRAARQSLWTTATSDNRRNQAERHPGASEAPERYPWGCHSLMRELYGLLGH